ncbi:sugar transporter [Bradyrhizobium sp. dw_78]|uniref:GumC family protein n=1 Tax=Bradyrhizobium sp. dw_78 TaxID=2719793 RepID=UPI001BD30C59|nr:sugar transporter [Bradyrhizobium sp. dw_78]
MLQKLDREDDGQGRTFQFQPPVDEEPDQSHLLRPSFYWHLIKRRAVFFAIPFVLVLSAGLAAAALWPASYESTGKILVESQQIPTELVRPTVTSAATERIQVIEQRTMTRENLLAIIDKFQLFPERRNFMSATQQVDLMRKDTRIEPVALPLTFAQTRRDDNPTVAFTVSFEASDPEVAAKVANELVTRILNEDLRDRTSRASDTTKFLAREVQRLQADNAAIDAKIAQVKLTQVKSAGSSTSDQPSPLAQLKAELVQKSALYSDRHPTMQALKRQIEAMEKAATPPPQNGADSPVPLDSLEAQQESVQKDLETASAKLAAAQMGETLEKDQQSEKLEVIEQPTVPQEPTKPNRRKIAGMALLLAFAAGGGLAFLAEIADKTIRRSSDVFSIVDSHLVVAIPYITTKAELRKRKQWLWATIALGLAIVAAALIAAYLFLPPLDLILAKARVGLFK